MEHHRALEAQLQKDLTQAQAKGAHADDVEDLKVRSRRCSRRTTPRASST
jgi:hypothetical protein